MPTISELRERQNVIISEARERLDQIGKTTDEARAKELETQHDAAMAEHDKIEALIARQEKLDALQKRATEREEEQRASRRPIPPDGTGSATDGGGKEVSYRDVFAKVVCGAEPSSLSEEERQILRKGVAEFRTQTAGTNSAGGYTVPTDLLNQIEISMKATGPMYDGTITQEFPTASGNPTKLPTIDDTSKSGGAHTEGAALTDDGSEDVTFGQKSLDAYSFDTEFVKWSWELSMDSIFAMEALLGTLLGERLGRIANRQLTVGTGSSAPNGIVTASALGVTAASATAITADELIDLEHAIDPAYRNAPTVGFMLHDTTLKAIRKLKDGEGNYLWTKGDFQAGVPSTINGRRYFINQDMDTLAAAKKVVLFGDFKKYWVRKVGSPVIGVLRERFWPDLGIAGLIRFDGELANSAAMKHLITAAS
ncbi:HK97 family phage major capsid protein [Azorhizobium sp. AG788]|uniref:phage major capsid protein n=1 Tax=Azorhizobium sp. AG788 TaxID=2183897 RepID=UPI00106020A0|nr:phage major capsid protein [Azorhizobium sp. AG788]TDT94914.1 HK97 family phage major capsid protein [Azorhizobium sp. AG788]